MKKKNVIIGVGVVLGICLWIGIILMAAYTSDKNNNYSQTIQMQDQEANENVKVFKVSVTTGKEPIEYIKFLENFDESKYEIIDISITDHSNVTRYYVTYKVIN